jgi:hypothetical protein
MPGTNQSLTPPLALKSGHVIEGQYSANDQDEYYRLPG